MNETIRKEFYRLSELVSTEQVVQLLVNVFGAENVKDFLLEEVKRKREETETN